MKFELKHVLDLPLSHHPPGWHAMPISPDGTKIAISTAPTELTILDSTQGLKTGAGIPVPEGALRIAAHPGQGPIAVMTGGQLQLLDPSGTLVSLLDLDPSWGAPKAVSYDPSGRLLCLSAEVEEEGLNQLLVLDARSLACLRQERLEG